jgi:hypothetical protein
LVLEILAGKSLVAQDWVDELLGVDQYDPKPGIDCISEQLGGCFRLSARHFFQEQVFGMAACRRHAHQIAYSLRDREWGRYSNSRTARWSFMIPSPQEVGNRRRCRFA